MTGRVHEAGGAVVDEVDAPASRVYRVVPGREVSTIIDEILSTFGGNKPLRYSFDPTGWHVAPTDSGAYWFAPAEDMFDRMARKFQLWLESLTIQQVSKFAGTEPGSGQTRGFCLQIEDTGYGYSLIHITPQWVDAD